MQGGHRFFTQDQLHFPGILLPQKIAHQAHQGIQGSPAGEKLHIFFQTHGAQVQPEPMLTGERSGTDDRGNT